MSKKILSLALALVMCLGVLSGCGGGTEDGGLSSGFESGKPGAESTKPNSGGHEEYDPVAVMNKRIEAVNDAVNFEFLGLKQTIEGGLLFYCPNAMRSSGEIYDYDPDKPLDYGMSYEMSRAQMEYIISEDTHAVLAAEFPDTLRRYADVDSDVKEIETDDLYAFYVFKDFDRSWNNSVEGVDRSWNDSETYSDGIHFSGYAKLERGSACGILLKGTDIVYGFRVIESVEGERTADPDYYDEIHLNVTNNAEFMSTPEFWEAFAQTVKFVASENDNTQYDGSNLIKETFDSSNHRDYRRKNAYSSVLGDDDEAYFADLADIDQDGVDELLVLEDDTFSVYSWKGGKLQRREHEDDVAYAKLIDMDQDGREELILVCKAGGYNYDVRVYSWGDSGIHTTTLDIDNWKYDNGLYHDKTTGDIYVGAASWGNDGEAHYFTSLTDSVSFQRDWIWVGEYDTEITYYIYKNGDSSRQVVDEDEYNTQMLRFELIEQIDLGSSDWKDSLRHTVEEVRQQLTGR